MDQRERLQAALEGTKIPDYMWTKLINYIVEGVPTGGFLHAILSNDLKRACNAADEANQLAIYDYVFFLHNNAPAACWGSPERVANWMEIAKQVKELM